MVWLEGNPTRSSRPEGGRHHISTRRNSSWSSSLLLLQAPTAAYREKELRDHSMLQKRNPNREVCRVRYMQAGNPDLKRQSRPLARLHTHERRRSRFGRVHAREEEEARMKRIVCRRSVAVHIALRSPSPGRMPVLLEETDTAQRSCYECLMTECEGRIVCLLVCRLDVVPFLVSLPVYGFSPGVVVNGSQAPIGGHVPLPRPRSRRNGRCGSQG